MAYTANVLGVAITAAPAGAGTVAAIAYTGAGVAVLAAAVLGVVCLIVGLLLVRVAVVGHQPGPATAVESHPITKRRRR